MAIAGLDPVGTTTKAVGGIVGKIADTIDELHTSPEELAKIELEQSKLIHENNNRQIELNTVEAKHSSLFVAGWRPFLGWGLVIAVLSQLVLIPYLIIIFGSFDIDITDAQIEIATVIQLLFGLLGLSGMRTFEKYRGVDTKGVEVKNKLARLNESEKRAYAKSHYSN